MCQSITEGRAFDVIEIDAASNRGIDEIRDLRERVGFAPNLSRYKVYIIDEVHMLTEAASNALLKTLEEPPPHVVFILATTETHKVLPTILSRCQRFDFRRLPQGAVISRLRHICDQEGIDIQPPALSLLAKASTGSLRDAENLLEQLVAYHGNEVELHQVQSSLGITADWLIKGLAKHIVNGDLSAGMATINAVTAEGLDLRQFNREIIEYLRALLLVKAGSGEAVDVTPDDLAEMNILVANVPMGYILKAVKLFGQIDLRLDNYSPLPLELALVECTLPEGREVAVEPSPKEDAGMSALVECTLPEGREVTVEPSPQEDAGMPALEECTLPEGREVTVELSPKEDAGMPALEGSAGLDYFRSQWNQVVEALRGAGSKGNLDAFLRSACEPVAVEGNTLVLGFYYSFHLERIEDPKYRHLVERKVSEVFGSPYQVRCILKARDKKPSSQGHLVKAAMEIGGKIINVEEK
jgi:DNA polymerase-3 subunit gamma/tau